VKIPATSIEHLADLEGCCPPINQQAFVWALMFLKIGFTK
jgi:hypothetical protein